MRAFAASHDVARRDFRLTWLDKIHVETESVAFGVFVAAGTAPGDDVGVRLKRIAQGFGGIQHALRGIAPHVHLHAVVVGIRQIAQVVFRQAAYRCPGGVGAGHALRRFAKRVHAARVAAQQCGNARVLRANGKYGWNHFFAPQKKPRPLPVEALRIWLSITLFNSALLAQLFQVARRPLVQLFYKLTHGAVGILF